jgi:aminoglycoside 6'-N-acetyltransferase I
LAAATDATAWLQLRLALWPEGPEAEHRDEIDQFFAGQAREPQAVLLAEDGQFFAGQAREPHAVLLAEDGAGRVFGLAELSIRPCAEGCRTNRVAYLEGWFVLPEARGRGAGRALVAAAEEWGRSRGCTEFASDAQPDNRVSTAAHLALGFTEAGLVRCFRKDL